ncbi:MAG: hypothetical protein COB02_17285 [Candidatus Cloacimonadota bacterium]|nr:MAG: hypothetical protein COB02_17285 [Candidatus Cloacimonadota bacterium]
MTLPKNTFENYLSRSYPNCTVQHYGNIWDGICQCGYKFSISYLISYGSSWNYSKKFLEKVTRFKSLFLSGNYIGNSPEFLSKLNHLVQLSLIDYPNFEFKFMKNFSKLEILEISELKIKNLEDIEYLRNLKTLIISEISKLEDISSISLLKLKTLSLVVCNKIKNLTPIGKILTLKDFSIETKVINNVKFLSNLKALEVLNISAKVEDKDFNSLLKLKNLKEFSTKKRNLCKNQKIELELALPKCKIELY